MAGIRQTFNRKTGKPHKKWRIWYFTWNGKRKWETGYECPERSLALAQSLEAREMILRRNIELGVENAPTPADLSRAKLFSEAVKEYLDWGKTQGGRGGRQWSAIHLRMRTRHLTKFWPEHVALKSLADLDGCLSRIEKVLRELKSQKVKARNVRGEMIEKDFAGKTVQQHAESIHAFCLWAKGRGYLSTDPLDGLAPWNTDAETNRRAMTARDLERLFASCKPYRRLTYETALYSGLRVSELAALTVDHLDSERQGLKLEAAWTKNRKPGFQPLPADLFQRLTAAATAGLAAHCYATINPTLRKNEGRAHPLLYVSTNPARDLDEDLKAAGLPKYTPHGKLDFHALRASLDTILIEQGATVKETQTLMRHADPKMTMNTYAKLHGDPQLLNAIENVAKAINKTVPCAFRVQRKTAKANVHRRKVIPAEGFEPQADIFTIIASKHVSAAFRRRNHHVTYEKRAHAIPHTERGRYTRMTRAIRQITRSCATCVQRNRAEHILSHVSFNASLERLAFLELEE